MRSSSIFIIAFGVAGMVVGVACGGDDTSGGNGGSGGQGEGAEGPGPVSSSDSSTSTTATTGTGGEGATGGMGTGGMATGGMGNGGMATGGMGNGGMATGGMGNGGMGTGGMGTGGMMSGCLDAEDCANNGSQVCDPPTKMCAPFECSTANPTCPNANDICLIQFPNSNNGACYATCAPFSASCGAGAECVDLSGEGMAGACIYTGSHTQGQACTPHDINTDCVVGYDCRDQGNGNECLEQCNFWGPAANCTAAAQSCFFLSLCLDTGTVHAVALQQNCPANAAAGDSCAQVGDRITGSCQDTGSGTLVCSKSCRVNGADCVTGTCNPFPPPFDLFGACF